MVAARSVAGGGGRGMDTHHARPRYSMTGRLSPLTVKSPWPRQARARDSSSLSGSFAVGEESGIAGMETLPACPRLSRQRATSDRTHRKFDHADARPRGTDSTFTQEDSRPWKSRAVNSGARVSVRS